ncbi:GNAT family N-acetyltransferase [Streptococcus pseudoporcinus]|uniref:Acetyltransferase, GNAT family n=1 Tax=Streptococcus pseudoporcinus LQ 940-04 TaxID=875093 RepID=G5K9W1_9STRE|nr:GNAT family N-acetyltransferase [Streptococcus pseudoporcinus]EFR44833.1 acetyltransferase, GNAT family [Streptococcus pseudoporcinus SPIN 20026]EHI65189.1 acetyltransferase, GNAT family [Streptococcus pseudoporcinus LQ 940-04]VEF93484.1 phosphinothricin N-acetyltransferase [Streptococcus pseudoporcinus]
MIRFAHPSDAKQLVAIYQPYVEKAAITFDHVSPTVGQFQQRMQHIQAFYPYLVYEEEGRLLAYAYASHLNTRAAYAWSCEVSIYVDQHSRGKGIGRCLYQALERYLAAMGIINCNACIATSKIPSSYLPLASHMFHQKLGYQLVGTFHKVGYKFDQWFDVTWMEKALGHHTRGQKPPRSIHEVLKDGKKD